MCPRRPTEELNDDTACYHVEMNGLRVLARPMGQTVGHQHKSTYRPFAHLRSLCGASPSHSHSSRRPAVPMTPTSIRPFAHFENLFVVQSRWYDDPRHNKSNHRFSNHNIKHNTKRDHDQSQQEQQQQQQQQQQRQQQQQHYYHHDEHHPQQQLYQQLRQQRNNIRYRPEPPIDISFFSGLLGDITRFSLHWGFICACVFIWFQWQAARRDPSLRDHLQENFVTSQANIDAGRWWTLVSSAISHQGPGHLGFNMVSFHAFLSVARRMRLSPLTIAAVGVASAASCGYAQLLEWRRKGVERERGALGASGLVAGLGGFVTVLVPHLPFSFMFIPVPIPLWILTPGLIAWDMYNTSNLDSTVGHAGHVGGALCGLAMGFARKLLLRF